MKKETEQKHAAGPMIGAVKAAFLHQTMTWPGIASTEKTITDKKLPGVKMWLYENGLELMIKGEKCFVPAANIANCLME